jgi:hypothetical protein
MGLSKMLRHGLQLAAFQCCFLSTIYISRLHISTVSIFQWQVLSTCIYCISTNVFQLYERGSVLRASVLFVCRARGIVLLCLRASAFPYCLTGYHKIILKNEIFLYLFTIKQLYICKVYTHC